MNKHCWTDTCGVLIFAMILLVTWSDRAFARAKQIPEGAFELSLGASGLKGDTVDLGQQVTIIVRFLVPDRIVPDVPRELIVFPHRGEIEAEGNVEIADPEDSVNVGAMRWIFDPADMQPGSIHSFTFAFTPTDHLGPGVHGQLFLNGLEDNAWIEFRTDEPEPEGETTSPATGLPTTKSELDKILYAE